MGRRRRSLINTRSARSGEPPRVPTGPTPTSAPERDSTFVTSLDTEDASDDLTERYDPHEVPSTDPAALPNGGPRIPPVASTAPEVPPGPVAAPPGPPMEPAEAPVRPTPRAVAVETPSVPDPALLDLSGAFDLGLGQPPPEPLRSTPHLLSFAEVEFEETIPGIPTDSPQDSPTEDDGIAGYDDLPPTIEATVPSKRDVSLPPTAILAGRVPPPVDTGMPALPREPGGGVPETTGSARTLKLTQLSPNTYWLIAGGMAVVLAVGIGGVLLIVWGVASMI